VQSTEFEDQSINEKYVQKRNLIFLILISLSLRLYFIFVVPTTWNSSSTHIQAFNDEASHVNYVRYFIDTKSLPVHEHHVQEAGAFERNEFEYYQPPLSYILTGLFAWPFRTFPQIATLTYVCRCFVCLLGLVSIFLFYQLLVSTDEKGNAFFITLMYAFLPVHWRHTSSYSNDALLWILVILILFYIHRKIRNGFSSKDQMIEGCLLGLGLWTKSSLITFVLSYFIIGLLDCKKWKAWIIPALVGIVISIPYFVRNVILYHELFGIKASHGPETEALRNISYFMVFRFFRGLCIQFVFPFDTLSIPIYLKLPAYLACVFLSGAFLYCFIQTNIHEIRKKQLSFQGILSIFVITSFGAMVIYNWNHLQTEFRNLFYVMPMILLLASNFIRNSPFRERTRIGFVLPLLLYPIILVFLFG
jgi:hypothetical protein